MRVRSERKPRCYGVRRSQYNVQSAAPCLAPESCLLCQGRRIPCPVADVLALAEAAGPSRLRSVGGVVSVGCRLQAGVSKVAGRLLLTVSAGDKGCGEATKLATWLAVTRVANSQPFLRPARVAASPVSWRMCYSAIAFRTAHRRVADDLARRPGHHPAAVVHIQVPACAAP